MWSAQPAAAQNFAFAPPASRACTPDHTPTRVVATDVDGDGSIDLLLPGRNIKGLVNWVPLDALGVPGIMQSFACTGQTDAVVVGDFNADTRPDLAFAVRAFDGRVAVYARGERGLPIEPVEFALDREPHSLAIGDWNGDGALDLASLQYGNSVLLVLRNDGAGAFTVVQRLPIEPWAGGTVGPQELLVGDVTGDGRADLVGSMLGTHRIDVFVARSDGSFELPVAWEAPLLPNGSRPGITTAALGDVDGDGDIDIVATLIATGGTQPILVFANDGTGGFAQRTMFDGPKSGYGWGTALGDLDQDGDLDVVTGTALPGGLYVWENTTPRGGFAAFELPQLIGNGTFVRDICIANLDGDCDLDIAYAEIANNTVRVYRQLRDCGGFAALHAQGAASIDDARVVSDAGDARRVRDAHDANQDGAALGRALAQRASSASELALLIASFGPPPRGTPAPAFLLGGSGDGGGSGGSEPSACGPGGAGGRCDEPHATPGCFTTPCCEMVCTFDPGCCTLAWDQVCVDIAAEECDGLVCPQYGPCTEVHADPGCEDTACCERITRLDGYCAGALWDHLCVELAATLCGTSPCTVAIPPEAVSEAELCYEHLNDGPNSMDGTVLHPACGQVFEGVCTTDSPRDTDWYRLPGTGDRRVQFTVTAEFPCEVHLVTGEFAGPLRAATSVYGGQCAPVVLDACLTGDAPWYAVVTLGTSTGPIRQGQPCMVEDPRNPWPPKYDPVPGFDGVRYVASLACAPCGHPADLNHDGIVGGADLGILLAAWGLTGPRPEDLNGDGVVGGADLGFLLAAWGPVLD